MRRIGIIGAIALILLGALLFLQEMGIITFNVWALVGPLCLVALGVWLLWRTLGGRRASRATTTAQEVVIPLEGTGPVRLHVRHGAGRLRISAGAGPGELVKGTFAGGLDHHSRRDGDVLDVTLQVPTETISSFGWMGGWGRGMDWSFGLSSAVALSLSLETGANDARLDLSALRVTELQVQTGASSTDVTLPAAAGLVRVRVQAGAAAVTIRVPPGVAARIHTAGLVGVSVDTARFPRADGGYASPDYATAQNKAEIDVEAGAGSISVR